MKNIAAFLFAFLLFPSFSRAQIITVDITKDLEYPVIFPNKLSGEHALLFYSDKRSGGGNFKFQLAVLDSAGSLIRQDMPKEIQALEDAGKKLKLLGYYADAQTLFAYFRSKDLAWRVTVDRKSGEMKANKAAEFAENEDILGGFCLDSSAVILCRGVDPKRGRCLNLYRPQGAVLKKSVCKGKIPMFFNAESYDPMIIHPGEDLSPSEGVRYEKIFCGENKIYFTYDKTPNVLSSDVLNLSLMTADLSRDSVYYNNIDFANKGKTKAGASGSAYIFEEKLFQLYFDKEQFGLTVRSLPDEKILFERFLSGEDSLSLLNSPVNKSGTPALAMMRKINSTSRLIRLLQPVMPYVYVKKSEGEYLLGMGGYELSNSGPTYSMRPGGMGMGFTPGYSYERSISFYTVLKASGTEQSSRRFETTILSRINEARVPENGRFVQMNGQSKYLYYKNIDGGDLESLVVLGLKGY